MTKCKHIFRACDDEPFVDECVVCGHRQDFVGSYDGVEYEWRQNAILAILDCYYNA